MFGTYRTILAQMVVSQHLGGAPVLGAYAVFGFYILSGYLMTFIMQRNYGYTLAGVGRYATNRFLRIYPLYWVSIVFSAALISFLGETFTANYHKAIYLPHDMAGLIRNILLYFPHREAPRLTPPAWALTVELVYYLLIGVGLSKNKMLVCCWLALSICYHMGAVLIGAGWVERYFTIPAASLPFATGAFVYHYRDDMLRYARLVNGTCYKYLPLIILCLQVVNWSVGCLTGSLRGIFFYNNYILCAVMVVVLSERRSLPWITTNFDKMMGDFSYPMYLVHYQVGLIVSFVFDVIGVEHGNHGIVFMLASIPLIFLASFVLTAALENPINLVRAKVRDKGGLNGNARRGPSER